MIIFKNHRLRVGYRKEDWHDVWYAPAAHYEPDDDDYSEFELYKSPYGGRTANEPTEGEVVWIGNFDIKQCESSDRKERMRKHRITLYRAWKYCDETDPEQVRRLEEELNQPDCRRWQSWFTHAKKWKRTKLQSRKRKRNDLMNSEPVQAVLASGTLLSEVDITSDSEDSAYGSEAEREMAEERRKKGLSMPPPPRPKRRRGRGRGKSSRKSRKGGGGGDDDRANDNEDEDDFPALMSGGLGELDRSWTPRYNEPNGLGFIMDVTDEADPTKSARSKSTIKAGKKKYQATTIEGYLNDNDDLSVHDLEPGDENSNSMSTTQFDARPPEGPPDLPAFDYPLTPKASQRTIDLGRNINGMAARNRAAAEQTARSSLSDHGVALRRGSGSGSSSNAGVGDVVVNPAVGRDSRSSSRREGSVMDQRDRDNAGLDDDVALARALRLSERPGEDGYDEGQDENYEENAEYDENHENHENHEKDENDGNDDNEDGDENERIRREMRSSLARDDGDAVLDGE